ncbi:MAG TPA: phosphatidylinositol mannoside acyltransferase [Acidimicrobiia bacterium]|nr:phosphatidylinositol mannoside acyltransferase [Acidimicrobiia bacterium]
MRSKTTLGQWITYACLRLAVAVLGSMPESWMRRLGHLGGTVWFYLDRPRRRIVHRHLRRLGESPRRAREVFRHYGRYWAESFWVRTRHFDMLWSTMEVDGTDNLKDSLAQGKGVIVVLPHLGNWEFASLIARHHGIPLVAVAERLANRKITEWFTRQRNMFGIEIILTGRGNVRNRLRESLAEGKLVCLLSDRDLSGRGIEVEFFGEKTTLPAGPVVLARATGAPVLPVAIYFKDGPGHRATIHPALDLTDMTPGEGAQVIASKLEEMIREDPVQWHLVQPNWPSDRR